MWFDGFDVPESLVGAHNRDELVLFVGAGASRDDPSGLPDFFSLVLELARSLAIEVTDELVVKAKTHPDILLGDWEEEGSDVHSLAAVRIGDPASHPNPLHQAIVDLALSGGTPRIVTTNYDRHLSECLKAANPRVTEYRAPALPMGNEFDGIVYLHGSLDQSPENLVLTDKDFGRAYLTDAWASRFLERMFAQYAVLFIGYSLGDVVMQYLSRGLVNRGSRFVMTDSPHDRHWRSYGLTPVGYEAVGSDHSAARIGLSHWARTVGMSLREHNDYVLRLTSAEPSSIPHEMSYLEATVQDPIRVRFFVAHARGEGWLRWASSQPAFQALFQPHAEAPPTHEALARWFAQHYVVREDSSSLALEVFRESGAFMGATLQWAIGRELGRSRGDDESGIAPWVLLLEQNGRRQAAGALDGALGACRMPGDREQVLYLFGQLSEPLLQLGSSWTGRAGVSFDIDVRGDPFWLEDARSRLLAPHVTALGVDLLTIVEAHIASAHLQLKMVGLSESVVDALLWSGFEMSGDGRDGSPRPMDVLLDAARDCLEDLCTRGVADGRHWVDRWARSDISALRRLAIHVVDTRMDLDPSAKIEWLVSNSLLLDGRVGHEVSRLVADVVASIPERQTTTLIEMLESEVLASPQSPGPTQHAALTRLRTIAEAVPSSAASDTVARIESDHPGLALPSGAPALALSGEFVVPRPPMSPEALHEAIAADVANAAETIRKYEGHVDLFAPGPRWNDALALVSETVAEYPLDGVQLLDVEGLPSTFVGAVILGWSRASVEREVAEAIIRIMKTLPLEEFGEDVARLLGAGSPGESGRFAWHTLESARELARSVAALAPHGQGPLELGWLTWAINHPAGYLAQFWVHAIASDWASSTETWSGLPPGCRVAVDELLDSTGQTREAAETLFASQLLFFFGADADWAKSRVLPLLTWGDPQQSLRAWQGFLSWGRFSDALLDAGLLDAYRGAVRNSGLFAPELQARLAMHLADVALLGASDPSPWLLPLTREMSDEMRTLWIVAVGRRLDSSDRVVSEEQWSRWMMSYWEARVEKRPFGLDGDEGSAIAGWVTHLVASFARGVELCVQHPAALDRHGTLARHLLKGVDSSVLEPCATLFAHLLKSTASEGPFWGSHNVLELAERLRSAAKPEDWSVIRDECLRLGCGDVGPQ